MCNKLKTDTFLSIVALVGGLLFSAGSAFAAAGKDTKQKSKEVGTTEVPVEEQSEAVPSLQLSEGISDRIYAQTNASLSTKSNGSLAISSSMRLFFPKDFTLSNNYFVVPYARASKALPGFVVGSQIPIFSWGSGQFNSLAHLGYAYTQGIVEAESETGLTVKDAVELQWIPFQAGFEATTRTLTSQNIRLGLQSTAGLDWYTQSGQLDGMNQTYWVPRYEVGGSMILFTGNDAISGGFDGIRLAGIFYRTFSTKQKNRGWAADIGARYAF